VRRAGYLEEFLASWQGNVNTRLIWVSMYTPQIGELSTERLSASDRENLIADIRRLRPVFSKLQAPDQMLEAFSNPPSSPSDCTFALTTECFSSDLERRITPCQFGGNPDCANCGCVASAGLEAIARHRLPAGLRVRDLFDASLAVGRSVARIRDTLSPPARPVRSPRSA
jgi:hypothetical protein